MSEIARDADWQRLDLRMLLVHPVKELLRFLPALVAVFVLGGGAGGGGPSWETLGVLVPIGLGLLRYLTTTFRIAGGRVEVRRGLLSRHVLSTPVDRVRTVDLTSSPIHRLLGLTTVRIGTGTASSEKEERLDLDGLPVARARELRAELLQISDATPATHAASYDTGAQRTVLRLDPRWARFAPLTTSGVVIGTAALGGFFQLVNLAGGFRHLDGHRIRDDASGVAGVPTAVLVVVALLVVAVIVSLLSVIGYLVTNWGFRLTRVRSQDGSAWQLQRGLLTTRETTLDDDRLAGVVIGEPLGLRLIGGARLSAIVTGLDRKQRAGSLLAPPAPRSVIASVGGEVLDRPGPVTAPLVGHGPRATRRRWTRAVGPALLVGAAAVTLVAAADAPRWLLLALLLPPVAAVLAADRTRALGHALVDGCLVSRKGSLDRHREMLEIEHVIGWNLRASWFQRRAGLTTLVATTAGGAMSVTVLDVPETDAVALTVQAMPELLAQFCG